MAKLPSLQPVKAVADAIRGKGKPPAKAERNRPKLLISIVNRGRGKKVRDVVNEISAALSISFTGYGTARTALLDYLGIGETEKTIVFSLIPEADEEAVMKEIRSQLSLYLAGRGISFTIPIAAVSEIVAGGLASAATNKSISEERIMNAEGRKYDLIVVSVNANFVETAMDAARAAGASGGTVIRARATENQKAEQFIGISLMREQEVIFILSKKAGTQAIMDALTESVGLKTPAGGVIFALPVDRTAGISARDEAIDEMSAEQNTASGEDDA